MTVVWLDGDFVTEADARLSVFDHGFTVGDGVFETMRTVGLFPFAVTRHLRRLRASAAGLGLSVPASDAELIEVLSEAADRVPAREARVRLTVAGGVGPAGTQRGEGPPTMLVVAEPLTPVPPTTTVCTVEWRRNEFSAVAGLKTTSYAENVVALARAREVGASEALFANTAGELCEGTGSNVFVVVDGNVITPPLSSGCLAGITRELVLEVADVREASVPFDVLDRADEVFITSSTRDVQAVSHVDGRALPTGDEPGPCTAEVAAAFARLLASTPDP